MNLVASHFDFDYNMNLARHFILATSVAL